MTKDQEQHLQRLKDTFCAAVDAKYRAGQAEHGGDLWRKNVLPMLMDEVVDFYAYAESLRAQIELAAFRLDRYIGLYAGQNEEVADPDVVAALNILRHGNSQGEVMRDEAIEKL